MNGSGKLLGQLPGVYHSSEDLRTLLSALETILFEPNKQALESQIAGIARLFSAMETPDEFLPWLAQWVALSHRMGLPLEQQRRLVGTNRAALRMARHQAVPDRASQILLADGCRSAGRRPGV